MVQVDPVVSLLWQREGSIYNVQEKSCFSPVFHSKKTPQRGVKAGFFYVKEYKKAMEFFNQSRARLATLGPDSPTMTVDDLPDPENACGWSVVDTAMAAMKHLYKQQWEDRVNQLIWSQIWTPKVEGLLELVKGCQRRIDQRNSAEKEDETYKAFVNADKFPEVEHAFWKLGHKQCTSKLFLNFSVFNLFY